MEGNIMDENQCRTCGSDNIVMVEYERMHPDHFDGIS